MLVLTRRVGETTIIDNDIAVTVLGIKGNQVRIGIEAPAEVIIVREELLNSGQQKAPHSEAHRLKKLLLLKSLQDTQPADG